MYIVDYLKIYYPEIVDGIINHKVSCIIENSKEAVENSIFVAINGYRTKGKNFIEEAILKGAKTIIYDDENVKIIKNINYVFVKSCKVELARLLKWFYHTRKKPYIIGITGTNGKTTVSTILYEFFKKKNKKVLYIGTSQIKSFASYEMITKITNTTPSIVTIYQNIYQEIFDYVVMEVSSQGIMEGRVLGIEYDIACFTNITQDHLDYHKNMDNYANAKNRLAIGLKDDGILVLNEEMSYYTMIKESSLAKLVTYSSNHFSNNATYLGRLTNRNLDSMEMVIWEKGNCFTLTTSLIGDFNLENILASFSILRSIGFSKKEVIEFYPQFSSVKGRMNVYKLNKDDSIIYLVVDFAHTPEGVKQVLEYFCKVKKKRLFTIIGCGGNRDRDKRPIIGQITTKLSDYTYFTEDNSRLENIKDIINDICTGAYSKNYEIIYQRNKAIDVAINNANNDDIILILGKGSEEYIISKTVKEFSDIQYLEELGAIRC